MGEEINQTEGGVHSPETMDAMAEAVLQKVGAFSGVDVPLYFDNGVNERKLVGTASIEPDGEILMQIDPEIPVAPTSRVAGMSSHPEIWMEPSIEEVWAKRRTY